MRFRVRRFTLLFFVALTVNAFAQLETGFGYTHLTGNFGLDGLGASVGYQFNRHVGLIAQGDFVWDTSDIGVFDLVPRAAGLRIKSNEQNYVGGVRVRMIGWKPMQTLEKRKLLPFGQFLMGVSRLNQKITNFSGPGTNLEATDQAFTWIIGGGVDYTISKDWLARGSIDLARTHFVDSGQSRARVHIGLVYVF